MKKKASRDSSGHEMGKRGKLCQEASMKKCVRGSVDEVRCEEGTPVE